MSEVTQIRQASNMIEVEGILKKLDFKMENNALSGEVALSPTPDSEYNIRFYSKSTTRDGNESKTYKGLQTFTSEAVSLASLLSQGVPIEEAQAKATKVRCKGKLERSEYYDPQGELKSFVQYGCNFFHRITDDTYNPKAEFICEVFLDRLKEEITRDGEETGRMILDTIIPLYGGRVVPMQFVAADEAAEYIRSNYEPKHTYKIWGDLVNKVERKTVRTEGFGKAKEEIKTNYTSELLVTSGTPEAYDDESDKAFTKEQIKAAMLVRETETLPSLLEKSKRGKEPVRGSGFAPSTAAKPAPKFNY